MKNIPIVVSGLTQIIMQIFAIICVVKGYKNYKSLGTTLPLFIIAFLSAIDSASLLIFQIALKRIDLYFKFSSYFHSYYFFAELFLLIYYFILLINSHLKTYTFHGSILILFSVFIFSFFESPLINNYKEFIIIEFIIVNSFCFYFLLKELKSNDIIHLDSEKLMIRNIFLFINTITPYSFIAENLVSLKISETNQFNFINDFCYIFLFYKISKIFKWKKAN